MLDKRVRILVTIIPVLIISRYIGRQRNRNTHNMDVQASIHGHNKFCVEFSKQILELRKDGNAVFSPITIGVAMSLAGAGAKGETLAEIMGTCFATENGISDHMHEFVSQIVNVVFADASPSGGPVLSFVNGAWVEQSMKLKAGFVDVVKKHYGTEPVSVDFVNKPHEVISEVNKWVSEGTKGRIQELLPAGSVDATSRLVLGNALYFLGEWQKQFDSSKTVDDKFHLINGDVVQVPMMTTKKKQFIKRFDDCKILRLPYVQGQDSRAFSMYIILPDKLDGLTELEMKIDVNFMESHLSKGQEVDVKSFLLPKFKLSFAVEAPETLKKLGLNKPFCKEADFSEMVEDPAAAKQLYISNVFHKAFVEVNEKGTEAAAATAATIILRSFHVPGIEEDFVADHPFMFVIKEDVTGVILFVGHVMNPLDE